MSEDRRCLVIDAQPTVRLGGAGGCSPTAMRWRRPQTDSGALELLISVGDFDVAIVDLCRRKRPAARR